MNNVTALYGSKMKWFAVLAGVFCLAIATGASAEETARPCKEDAAKLCKDVKPGGGAVAKCLKEHSSELSPACKANMEHAQKRVHEFKEACNEDAKKLCKDVKPGEGRVVQCLKKHESELTPACKASMTPPKGKK
jgi:hypothetical protein